MKILSDTPLTEKHIAILATDGFEQSELEEPLKALQEAGATADLELAYTLADGVALSRKLGLQGVVALSPTLKDVDMFLYLHRRHLAWVPKIAQALRDMKADGTYNRIMFDLMAE